MRTRASMESEPLEVQPIQVAKSSLEQHTKDKLTNKMLEDGNCSSDVPHIFVGKKINDNDVTFNSRNCFFCSDNDDCDLSKNKKCDRRGCKSKEINKEVDEELEKQQEPKRHKFAAMENKKKRARNKEQHDHEEDIEEDYCIEDDDANVRDGSVVVAPVEQVKVSRSTKGSQRISPSYLISKVLKDMPTSHKDAVKSIGFGGILHLDLPSYTLKWNDELLRSVDVDSVSIVADGKIRLEVEDVYIAYGLPLGGKIIEEAQSDNQSDEWINFVKYWRGLFGLSKGSPTNSQVITEIVKLMGKPVCDEFLWHFLLCVVNCCIRSTQNTQLNYRFLYSCMDLTKVKDLDWCDFVMRSFISSIEEYQQGTRSSYYTGPLPFLMVTYFDRLQRANIQNERRMPLTEVWKKEIIEERMGIEKRRGFGKGIVLDRLVVQDKKENKSDGDSESTLGQDQIQDFLQKFGELCTRLAYDFKQVYEMVEKAKVIFQDEDIGDEFQKIFSQLSGKFVPRRESETQNPSIFSQDAHLFEDEAFIQELDMAMKKAVENSIKKKRTKFDFSPPTFHLLSQSSSQSEEEHNQQKDEACEIPHRPKRVVENLPPCLRSPFMIENEAIFRNVHSMQKLVAEYVFGNGDDKEELYSDKLTKVNREELSSLKGDSPLCKNVVDAWASILTYENKRRGLNSLSRIFFSTEPYVILCTNLHFGANVPLIDRLDVFYKRLEKEMDFADILNFQRIDMVFFPIIDDGHYYLLCINFRGSSLDLIDNRLVDETNTLKKTYKNHPIDMLKSFASFVQKKTVGYVPDISSFKTRRLRMNWRSNENPNDSGVFLLKHMECYCGENDKKWDCGLKLNDESKMKQLRVEYCGRMLLHKLNYYHHAMRANGKKMK